MKDAKNHTREVAEDIFFGQVVTLTGHGGFSSPEVRSWSCGPPPM